MSEEDDSYFGRKRALVRNALAEMKGLASKVMHVLELRQDTRTALVEIGTAELAAAAGSDRRDVARALQDLVELRTIEILDEGGGFGHKKRIRLLVTPPPASRPSSPQQQGENPPELQGDFPTSTGGISSATGGFTTGYGGKFPPRSLQLQSTHTTGNGPADYGGKFPPFQNGTAPSSPPPHRRPPHPPGSSEEREEFLRGKGIYPKSARKYARLFTLKRLCELWREVDGNPRLKGAKRAAAFAVVLKEHAPERPGE